MVRRAPGLPALWKVPQLAKRPTSRFSSVTPGEGIRRKHPNAGAALPRFTPQNIMKVGIHSYCYHRQFGEVYPGQTAAESPLSFEKFMFSLEAMGIDGVSLESCFIPKFDAAYLAGIKSHLDSLGMDRVYAWGHPDGLEGGKNEAAYAEMVEHMAHARAIGAKVMRVVGSSLRFRSEPHGPQLEKLTRMFSDAAALAGQAGLQLALENHIDYNSDEILQLLKEVTPPTSGSISTPAISCASWTIPSRRCASSRPMCWPPTSRTCARSKGSRRMRGTSFPASRPATA
jgi:hypothetical protein